MQEKSSEEKWGCPENGTTKIWSIFKPKMLKEFQQGWSREFAETRGGSLGLLFFTHLGAPFAR